VIVRSFNRSERLVDARTEFENVLSEMVDVYLSCETNPLRTIESALFDMGYKIKIVPLD
jgi:hypothetical protein